jgi:diadenosine tetraphosphate (Ap4A) HIT family hydrolase
MVVKLMDLEEAQRYGIAPWDNVLKEDFHVVVYLDRYPCTPGHRLYVPKYDSDQLINQCLTDAFRDGQAMVAAGECDGFNIGMNWGTAAGQTVMWPHIHLIPRRVGDVADPVGGVRNTIPGKGNYRIDSNYK